MRDKELVFLGMAAKPKLEPDPLIELQRNKQIRRAKKDEYLNDYINALEDYQHLVQHNEGADMEETMKE